MDYVEPRVLPHHLLSNPLLVFAHPATHRVSPRPRTWPPHGPLTTLTGSAPPEHLALRSQPATPKPFPTSTTPTQPYVPTKPFHPTHLHTPTLLCRQPHPTTHPCNPPLPAHAQLSSAPATPMPRLT